MGITFIISTQINWQEFRHLRSEVAIGKGTIDNIYKIYDDEDEVTDYEYVYTFHSPWGDKQWSSFSKKAKYQLQEEVEIEYSLENPDIHRIKGLSNTQSNTPGFVFFCILLTLCFLGIVYYVYASIRTIKIVEQGQLTIAHLVKFYETSITVNDEPVYQFEFSFQDEHHKKHIYYLRQRGENSYSRELEYPICYLPESPNRAIMLHQLPESVVNVFQQEEISSN
ncbi:hypothetical protein [Persicobacter sp. CCB-QB2]|uniref:hypothetical protein n=1 Tax=Persicobacter sp. CCB-QB2 TaxID=1561025 RepID=UPI001C104C8C|nr:hypothetical protein [Persicobacter sp. CCB-QB2]